MALLRVEGVSKSFRGLRAVKDASFEVTEGHINALIGPNGAGKTTIFNLVAGVYAPDSGSIHFQDQKIDGLRPDEIEKLRRAGTKLVAPHDVADELTGDARYLEC